MVVPFKIKPLLLQATLSSWFAALRCRMAVDVLVHFGNEFECEYIILIQLLSSMIAGSKRLFAASIAILAAACLCVPISQHFFSELPRGAYKRPVILVPGLAGSVLQAKLHKDTAPWFCYKNSDWFNIWCVCGHTRVSSHLPSPARRCWMRDMFLQV
jgi:hypothetical protein